MKEQQDPAPSFFYPTIPDFVKVLEEHIKLCQADGRYVEAMIANTRKEELLKKQELVKMRHASKKAEIEELQLKEFESFTKDHAEKLTTQEAEFDLQVEQLKTKQKEELAELKEKSKKEGTKPKFSSELLRLRKQQETLAKMENYAEAHKIKLQADAYEAAEAENTKKDRKKAVHKKEVLLLEKHANELEVIQTKIAAKRDVFAKQQQDELQRLLKKFHNAIIEMDSQQNLELVKKMPPMATLKLDSTLSQRKTATPEAFTPQIAPLSPSPHSPKIPSSPNSARSPKSPSSSLNKPAPIASSPSSSSSSLSQSPSKKYSTPPTSARIKKSPYAQNQ